MDSDTVIFFLALLAVLAQVLVAVALVLMLGGLVSPALARVRDRVRVELGPQALGLAAAVAIICTVGSIYLSEGAGYPPCRLCWYQRYAMYPLAPFLLLATLRRWPTARLPAGVVAAVGGSISIYHILVERYPSLESGSCDPFNPCSIKWVEHFGYLTIPTMALSGFALIVVLLIAATPAKETS